jgi:2-(3-amino-3-carboxypropyl)histidine synthase
MEDDRALVDLGIAADIEESQNAQNVIKQPKKRFVGRRAATEAAKSSSGNASIEDSGAIQGIGNSAFAPPAEKGG